VSAPKRYTHADFTPGTYQPGVYAVDPRTRARYHGIKGHHELRHGFKVEEVTPCPEAMQSNEYWLWVSEN
jgi:hypothetical protein